MTSRIAVLGAGAWGLTIADLLASKDNEVVLWDRNREAIVQLRKERTRGKPPGLTVHESVRFESEISKAAAVSEIVIAAIPSHAMRDVCDKLAAIDGGFGDRIFVSCAKGIEERTLLLPSQVFSEIIGVKSESNFAILSGPNHAEEVCRHIPTLAVCCSQNPETAERVRELFMLPSFRVYTQSDCRGVELGGALKNVVAIAAGMCDGMGYGDNTKAALITRGVAEIGRAACSMGAHPQTMSGLAGLGDLIVTAMSRHSRNRRFGELVARGASVQEALEQAGGVVEGYRTARSAHDLVRKMGVEMPLIDAVYRVLYENAGIKTVGDELLQRKPKQETE